MTVIKKYPRGNDNNFDEWVKKIKAKNVNWALWGGWFDSDGSFSFRRGIKGADQYYVKLSLKDRDPVELFSKTFETSLTYNEYRTTTPNGQQYTAKTYNSILRGKRSLWFVDQIKKYILQKTIWLKPFLEKSNIQYQSYSESWTREEWVCYITTLLEGDGTIYDRTISSKKYPAIFSNKNYFLNHVIKELKKFNIAHFNDPVISSVCTRKDGTKSNGYTISLKGGKNIKNFYETILPFMTMDRKKQKVINNLKWMNRSNEME